MRALRDYIREHPACLGFFGICVILGIMVLYQMHVSRNYVNPKYVTQELQKGAEAEGINHPKSMARYLAEAAKEQDLDMALRGLALDERILGVSVDRLIEDGGEFYTDLAVAPSGDYREYNEIASAELTGQACEGLESLFEIFSGAKSMTVESVDFVQPEFQLSGEFQSKGQRLLEEWGGDAVCEVSVFLRDGEKTYILGLTLTHYAECWKIFSLGAELAGTTEQKPVREISPEEYEELKGRISEADFMNAMQDQVSDIVLFSEEEEGVEKLRLPANYFILNSQRGAAPEDVISGFILGIQRQDLVSVMSYCMSADEAELQHTGFSLLKKQAEVAKGIKKFCYSFLGYDYPRGEGALLTDQASGAKILKELDPVYFMYFDRTDMVPAEDAGDRKTYTVYCYYEGRNYAYNFTLEKRNGWQIHSISMLTVREEGTESRVIFE